MVGSIYLHARVLCSHKVLSAYRDNWHSLQQQRFKFLCYQYDVNIQFGEESFLITCLPSKPEELFTFCHLNLRQRASLGALGHY